MRVYEFSKQYDIPLRSVMQALADAGITIKSHMSVLTPEAIDVLQKQVNASKKQMVQKPQQREEPKPVMSVAQVKPEVVTQKIVKSDLLKGTPVEDVKSVEQKNKHIPPVRQKPIVSIEKIIPPAEAVVPVRRMVVLEQQSVTHFAHAAGKQVNDVILTMLKWGMVTSKNQILSEELVSKLAKQYDIPLEKAASVSAAEAQLLEGKSAAGEGLSKRSPIVVVIGHVDHGKTTLLDFIRNTRVAAREKGGITQHLGAYQVSTKQGNLVFLDTPGHEAFSKMRQRGVKVADIAILVVAADDGVMPQTIEAIKHARMLNVPLVVAVNKIDKAPRERLDVVKRQLAQHDVLVEDWGGSVVMVPVSAKTGEGITNLLDMVVLQAELMDLRADSSGAVKGFVLESRLEKGLGAVATLIIQHGTLHVGDYFKAGHVSGRVTLMIDSFGKRLMEVGPAIPVQVAGFSELPNAGDLFSVVNKEEYKKIAAKEERKTVSLGKQTNAQAINIIVKTDTNSSKEAVIGSLDALAKKEQTIQFNVIYAAAGDISESDVELAYNTGSSIIGLHVKAEAKAVMLAQRKEVTIELFDIIYRLIESLEVRTHVAEKVPIVKSKIGEARVLKVFDIKNIGVVAGCIVTEGRFVRDGSAIVWRGQQKIGEGKIASLQREKRAIKEVHTGFECGFIVEGVTDWKPDDRVECYAQRSATKN